eukprot:9487578-Pyramimonas_sp.AAC.1
MRMLAWWQAGKLRRLTRGAAGSRAAGRADAAGDVPRMAHRTEVISLAPNTMNDFWRSLGTLAASRAGGGLAAALDLD